MQPSGGGGLHSLLLHWSNRISVSCCETSLKYLGKLNQYQTSTDQITCFYELTSNMIIYSTDIQMLSNRSYFILFDAICLEYPY